MKPETKNPFRAALLERRPTLGAWVQIGHPAISEIFARAGMDWVCVDLEHGVIDLESMAHVFRGLRGTSCVPVARLPVNDATWIHRALDAGARGLVVPMVNSAAEAERAVAEAKYPPAGKRGFGYSRASNYGIDFRAYRETANRDIAVVVQIEHREAIARLDEILPVEGVDGAFIGPMDLSGSLGRVAELEHPEFKAALAAFLDSCRKYRVSAGLHILHPDTDSVGSALEAGYTCLALGTDAVFLSQGACSCLRRAGREP